MSARGVSDQVRLSRRRAIVFAAGLTALPGGAASAVADDEDVPKREPSMLWEIAVDCAGTAELGSSADPEARCNLEVDDSGVYLHEHATGASEGATFRLSSFDIRSGERRWVHDVGETEELDVYHDAVVLHDKTHVEVYDPETGALRFTAVGQLANVNRYGTLLTVDAQAITAVDPSTGSELWSSAGRLGAVCRDIVIVVTPTHDEARAKPFAVLDHRSGEVRWRSPGSFDPRSAEIACGNEPFVYTTDGEHLEERSAYDGWLTWSTPVTDAGPIEIYREVVLVWSGAAGETVTAVERETGNMLWELPAVQVGRPVSIVGRLRADATGVFVLHPFSGEVVTQTDPSAPGAPFRVVAVSDTRVVVASGSLVTTYGLNDLGTSWQLDVGAQPDDIQVSSGYLVVRTGGTLRGYG